MFRFARVAMIALSLALPAAADDAMILSDALTLGRQGDWPLAREMAADAADPTVAALVDWTKLRDGSGSTSEFAAFVAAHPDWPGLALLRNKGEAMLRPDDNPADIVALFLGSFPQSGLAALALADAYRKLEDEPKALETAIRAWCEMSLSIDEMSLFLQGYGEALSAHHAARMDMLLWQGRSSEAEAMLPLVPPDIAALAEARIQLRDRAGGVAATMEAVPAALKDHPGLAYDLFIWRLSRSLEDDAIALMEERSVSAAALGDPAMWATRRAGIARNLFLAGDAARAWRIASQHHLDAGGGTWADLEWLAGWIALEGLRDTGKAAEHFMRLADGVATPISKGRAYYWLGRAHEVAGNDAAAMDAFREGAKWQTSFYGQLAAEKAGLLDPHTLKGAVSTGPDSEGDWDVLRAGRLMYQAGDSARFRQFFAHAAETLPPDQTEAIGRYALDKGEPFAAIAVAKEAAQRGIVLPESYFPPYALPAVEAGIDPALVLAIIRRESEFNAGAVSRAKAQGLMQVLPDTAREVADIKGIPMTAGIADPQTNIRIGSGYLAILLEKYSGSLLLSLAAYNAGPTRVDRWITEYGDPRELNLAERIDWIERLPFEETRSYIQRVLEALLLYKASSGTAATPTALIMTQAITGQ